MILVLLAVTALAWWLHRDGLLLPNLRRLGIAAAAALIALRLLETGQLVAAGFVAAAGLAWWRWSAASRTASVEIATARTTLGVSAGAGRDEVHAAWRRAMTAAHPDRGGSTNRALQVTAARDLLLR